MMHARFGLMGGLRGLSALCLLAVSSVSIAQTPQERAVVDTFLKDWHKTNLIVDTEFDKLKPLGKQALPLLAEYLSDKELGFLAESAMQRIDPNGAMPYLLRNLPHKDPNIQRDTFRLANRRMMEYDWYVRSGKPPIDPALPAPRYASNTERYPYRQAIHDAAVQLLQAEKNIGAETEAIKTVGLTGDRRDLPLLRKYAGKEGGTTWEGSYHALSIAAMARLADKHALDTIAAELAKPVLPHPAEPYYRDTGRKVEPLPGAVVASPEDAQRMRNAASQAGFAMNRRLIPLLLRHMDDPPGQFHGDYADPSPAHEAMTALTQIVYGKEYAEQIPRSPEEWKQWGREHAKEFPR
ncbi:MAG: hypothetical protein JWN14_3208 [Chthonomonadales bacterium]|nr:hypothetical protein [Chthonomonadales bacterium]